METTVIEWLLTPSIWKVIISFILLIVLSFVPFMPMALIYGALAFAYPFWFAFIINVSGTVLGAIFMFVLCKYGLKGLQGETRKIRARSRMRFSIPTRLS